MPRLRPDGWAFRSVAPVLVAAAVAGGCGARPRSAPIAPHVHAVHLSRATVLLRLPARLSARAISLPILMYHRIDALKPTLTPLTLRLTVSPATFAAQMEWLKRHGFHAVSELRAFDALEHGAPLPRKPVLITFDDGYRDVLGKASPILHRLRMPATAYVITGRISGPDPSFLTWGDLRSLERRGIAIGSHTVTHADLTALPAARALAELRDSRAALQRHLGAPVQWFAYPFGREDARVVRLVREAGYVLAVTEAPGELQSARHPLELHRFEVLDSTGVAGLAALLGN